MSKFLNSIPDNTETKREMIDFSFIEPNPYNKEIYDKSEIDILRLSIEAEGLRQPLEVFKRIYDHAGEQMKVILHLVWATGLRVGEVANLQHNDIENNMIKVRGKVKTINSTREIPIPLELYKILKGIQDLLLPVIKQS